MNSSVQPIGSGQPGAVPIYRRTLAQALALGLVLTGEFVLFQNLNGKSAWIYPRWFDQIQYLKEAYLGYEFSLDHGFLAGVWQTLVNTSAQGTLHDFWALLVFTITGPSRAAALDVNMLWFMAVQGVTFLAVRRATRSAIASLVSVAFMAALLAPWSGDTGSVTDFRLDWMAACAYGVALGAAVATDGFRSTRGSAVFGSAVGVALLTRFLTGVYFGLIFIALFAWVLFRRDRWPRFWRLVLSKVVALAVAGPVFWINRVTIYNYYWIGHVAGPERALRDSHMGAGASVLWILNELSVYKIGPAALILAVATLGGLWILGAVHRARSEGRPPGTSSLGWATFAALTFLLVPFLVLSVHPTKAPQTVGIMLVPAVWLAVLGFAALARRLRPNVAAWVGLAASLSGGLIFTALVLRQPYERKVAEDSGKINALADYAYFRAEECDVQRPRLAATMIADSISADAFSVIGYERHHHWIPFLQTLPTGLFETTQKLALDRLGESDFVCLLSEGFAAWPYDRQMEAMSGVTRPWCDKHLVHLADLDALGFAISVFERPGLKCPGVGSAVDLPKLLGSGAIHGAPGPSDPPAAPVLVSSNRILWSADTSLFTRIRAAYSPVRYAIEGLPEGLRLDSRTGVIQGVIHTAGSFTARVTAANSRGFAKSDLRFTFGRGPFLTSAAFPQAVRAGIPAEFAYEAFSADGRLDYLDLNELPAGTFIARLSANDAEHTGWQGRLQVTFAKPGVHNVNARFVCYDPGSKDPYSYVDELLKVSVSP